MEPNAKKTISIVVPVYFNEPNLPDTIPQLLALKDNLSGYKLELIFVDDDSKDRSLGILLDHQKRFPKQIKVVKLTRNFGTMAALQAGLTVATGDCIGVIAADLQDPPELFLEMARHWEQGVKAIFAVRSDREESFLQKSFSNLYYALINRFALPGYPPGGFDFFLVDRQVIEDVNKIHEKNTNLMALIFWLGYQAVFIPYVRRKRVKGKSRWTLGKKIKLFVDTFVSFSYFPIRLFSFLGIIYAVISFSYGAFIFFSWLTFGIEVQGWVPMMLILTFTAGLQMTLLGILGEYLWRTLDEARGRPLFVIDTVYSNTENKDVLPNAILQENLAHITGYAHTSRVETQQAKPMPDLQSLTVERVRLIKLPKFIDLRGSLTFGEIGQQLPFKPQRYFVVFDVPSMEVRGEHAHRDLHQFLVCLRGSCTVIVDDGKSRDEIILDRPEFGVHLPPMIWGIQYKFTSDAILLVLASDVYDADDYIRDYGQYKELVNKIRPKVENGE